MWGVLDKPYSKKSKQTQQRLFDVPCKLRSMLSLAGAPWELPTVSPPLCEAAPVTGPSSLWLRMRDLCSISSRETKHASNFPAGPQGNHPKSHPVYYKRSLKQLLVPQRERRTSCSTCPKDLPLATTGSKKHNPTLPPHHTASTLMSPM